MEDCLEMSTDAGSQGFLDRTTLALGRKLSRRSVLKAGAMTGALGGVTALVGWPILKPIEAAEDCTNCHYCVSGCTDCTDFRCCSDDGLYCLYCDYCVSGEPIKLGNYICDDYCGSFCREMAC
jgi:hypothetical protein